MQQAQSPNYCQSLGAIGRYLDQNGYDSMLLCELADGFVVRAIRDGQLPQAIPFQVSDLQDLIHEIVEESKKRKRGRATVTANLSGSFVQRTVGGYQNLLSALGQQLDDLDANTVLVVELGEAVLVTYRTTIATSEAWDAFDQSIFSMKRACER